MPYVPAAQHEKAIAVALLGAGAAACCLSRIRAAPAPPGAGEGFDDVADELGEASGASNWIEREAADIGVGLASRQLAKYGNGGVTAEVDVRSRCGEAHPHVFARSAAGLALRSVDKGRFAVPELGGDAHDVLVCELLKRRAVVDEHDSGRVAVLPASVCEGARPPQAVAGSAHHDGLLGGGLRTVGARPRLPPSPPSPAQLQRARRGHKRAAHSLTWFGGGFRRL